MNLTADGIRFHRLGIECKRPRAKFEGLGEVACGSPLLGLHTKLSRLVLALRQTGRLSEQKVIPALVDRVEPGRINTLVAQPLRQAVAVL